MGKIIKISALSLVGLLALLVIALDIWGFATLGSITLESNPAIDEDANKVVMVFGATGSVGDGLLKAAVEDPNVDKVYVITRRTSPRIEAGVASGKVVLRMHKDFTDYASVSDILGQTNTVMWSLGTTSIGVDDATYTLSQCRLPGGLCHGMAGCAQRCSHVISLCRRHGDRCQWRSTMGEGKRPNRKRGGVFGTRQWTAHV